MCSVCVCGWVGAGGSKYIGATGVLVHARGWGNGWQVPRGGGRRLGASGARPEKQLPSGFAVRACYRAALSCTAPDNNSTLSPPALPPILFFPHALPLRLFPPTRPCLPLRPPTATDLPPATHPLNHQPPIQAPTHPPPYSPRPPPSPHLLALPLPQNYETVKVFANEHFELAQFGAAIDAYQGAEFVQMACIALLNMGQSAVVFSGLALGALAGPVCFYTFYRYTFMSARWDGV